jgi:hypothetical protein
MDKLRKEHPVIAFLSDVSGATAASEYAVETSAKSEAGDYGGVDIALDAVQITGIKLLSRLFDASLIDAGVTLVPQTRGALRAAEGSVASKGVAANRIAGQAGESFLARPYGGANQVTLQTSMGRRVIDNLAGGIARESKVGRTSLTSTVRGQIAKDAELLGLGRIDKAEWHFFPGQTGVGPTAPLRPALEKAGIGIAIH